MMKKFMTEDEMKKNGAKRWKQQALIQVLRSEAEEEFKHITYPIYDKELYKQAYLRTIKGIQECNEMGVSPYSLNNERIRLHKKIADLLGLKGEAEYLRLKEVFSNMELICGLYSYSEEWRLRGEIDISLMANNLHWFLGSAEARLFLEGDVSALKNLPCFN